MGGKARLYHAGPCVVRLEIGQSARFRNKKACWKDSETSQENIGKFKNITEICDVIE
jgi:hypothetical protein